MSELKPTVDVGASQINVGSDLRTTGDVELGGPVTLTADVTVLGDNVTFSGPVDSAAQNSATSTMTVFDGDGIAIRDRSGTTFPLSRKF